jgi:hypothetical protein
MKEHIEHQIIKKDGAPLFVIVPYDEYLQLQQPDKKVYFPHEVVEKSVVEEIFLNYSDTLPDAFHGLFHGGYAKVLAYLPRQVIFNFRMSWNGRTLI